MMCANKHLMYIQWYTVQHCQFHFNTLRPRQNGYHFPENIFKCIFLNENVWISLKVLLKYVSQDPFNNIPALVQMVAWCRPGDKPLSEPCMCHSASMIQTARSYFAKFLMGLAKSAFYEYLTNIHPHQNDHRFHLSWYIGMVQFHISQCLIWQFWTANIMF